MKHLLISCIFLLIALCSLEAQTAAQNKKKVSVKEEITNKNFAFVAKWVVPMTGRMRQLTDLYDVRMYKDSLIAYLPFFGRSYIAPDDPTNISVNFTSTKFTYTVSNRKKGGWDILIKFEDQNNFETFSFTVFDDGTAYLTVTSRNSETISYNGYIEAKEEE